MGFILLVILLFVGLGILILLHVCLIMIESRRESSGTSTTMESETFSEGRSMSKHEIEKLPCYDYVANDNENDTVECAVCLEDLVTGDKCRLLPTCKHSFHAHCLDQWLPRAPICPVCRVSCVDSQNECLVIDINRNGHLELNNGQLRENPETDFTMQCTENSKPEG